MTGSLRIFSFDGGLIHTLGVRFINRNGDEETRNMADPNHCYLIEHPDGLLMWDTGLPDYIAALPDQTLVKGKFRFSLACPLQQQMEEAGYPPQQVRLLAFSHLQIDHAGNSSLFPNARVFIQADEFDMAFGPNAAAWGYVLDDYSALARQDTARLRGDMDLFGDGKVVLLSAPGHTPGHQVLYVDLPKSGPLLLSGDLYYDPKDPVESWMPAWNVNLEQTLETMTRLENFASERGARWLINHSRAQREITPIAPAWIE